MLGVKILNPVPFFFFLSWGFSFALSAVVSCDKNRIDNGDDDDDPGLNNFSEMICFVRAHCLFFSMIWYGG